MYIKANSLPNKIIIPVLNIFSIIFKTVSFLNLKIKAIKQINFSEALIISIDNLSFGGTGKTSLAMALGQYLEKKNMKFAIISRGYRSMFEKKGVLASSHHSIAQIGDEAKLLKTKFPQQDIFIGKKRVKSIKKALQRGNNIILLDDGFQSPQIFKDIRIMLINPQHPYFYLRNFKFLIKEDNVILYYQKFPPAHKSNCSGLYYFKLKNFLDKKGRILKPGNAPIVGFSALGDNTRFKNDLTEYNLLDFKNFPDHHKYTEKDLHTLNKLRKTLNAKYLVCTEKDYIKQKKLNLTNIPLIYTQNVIKFNFKLEKIILNYVQKKGIIQT